MSVTTNQPRGLNLPRSKPPIVPVTQENVRDWWALLVNRKAYTRQPANPQECLRDVTALRKALAPYPLQLLGNWSFYLVLAPDWKPLARSHGGPCRESGIYAVAG